MKRIDQKKQTRQELLSAAYREFSQGGFLATKTANVAAAAGISHGALFLHFPTKDELLISVIDEFGMRIGAKLQQLAAKECTSSEVLAAHLEAIEECEPFYAHLVTEGPLLGSPIRTRIFMIQSGIGHYLERTLLKKPNPPPIHLLLNSWLGLVHYYLINRDLFAPGKSVIATCGKELLNHFIKTQNLE